MNSVVHQVLAMKRLLDIIGAAVGLLLTAPVLALLCVAICWQDYRSPFYVARRVGRGGRTFRMVKLRSMIAGADQTGVDSTSGDDLRITRIGRFVRRFKLDELPQLWNVLLGHMSFVGPRPNVERETAMYTALEQQLLLIRPGVTDFSSIVFADEAEILRGKADPDIAYNQMIRPWKSRLGLFYIEHRSFLIDLRLIFLTVLGAASRTAALRGVRRELIRLEAPTELCNLVLRAEPLVPQAPPGSDQLVTSRG